MTKHQPFVYVESPPLLSAPKLFTRATFLNEKLDRCTLRVFTFMNPSYDVFVELHSNGGSITFLKGFRTVSLSEFLPTIIYSEARPSDDGYREAQQPQGSDGEGTFTSYIIQLKNVPERFSSTVDRLLLLK